MILAPLHMTTPRSSAERSSRTFPGHPYSNTACIASVDSSLTGLPFSRASSFKKCCTSGIKSSRRSRNGGSVICTTLSLKYKSSLNFPSVTICAKFLLVAAMTRTSTLIVVFPPTRSSVLSPKTRNNLTCKVASISPISSSTNVPPFACSNRPMRRSNAPVKAPFSCPKSSLSNNCALNAAQCTITSFSFGRPLKL